MSTNVLITGANRGIGQGLLSRYLSLPNHTVVAAVRDPSHSTSKDLDALPKADGSKLVIVKIDARRWQDPFAAVEDLTRQGIHHLDIVIANAGIASTAPLVVDAKEDDLRIHYETNAMGIVSLYQAVYPLLKDSKRRPEPIFLTLGTQVASFNAGFPMPNGVYGPSKAAAHWLSAKINSEDAWLNSFAISPGFVQTDMGNAGADMFGMDEATRAAVMITRDQSCDGIINVLASSSKEAHGGKLIDYKGDAVPW